MVMNEGQNPERANHPLAEAVEARGQAADVRVDTDTPGHMTHFECATWVGRSRE